MADEDNKFILHGPPELENLDAECRSLGEFIIKKLRENGDRVAFIDGITSRTLTFKDLLEQSLQMAKCLQHFGITDADSVGLVSENRLEFPVITFATFFLGAYLAPQNVTYTERELDHAFNLSKPKIVFTSGSAAERVVNTARKNSGFVRKVVILGDGPNSFGKDTILFDQFLNNSEVPKDIVIRPKPEIIRDKVALILCSSGTTGLPKGVLLTHENVLVCANQMKHHAIYNPIPKDEICFLGVIPWFHSFGCITMTTLACLGHKIVSIPRFEERTFLGSIEKHRVSIIFMVPPLLVFLAKSPLVDEYDLSSLVELSSGAAPLSKEVEDAVKKRIGVRTVIQGYGMSETTLGVLKQKREINKPGSVGTLSSVTSCKVVDTETGKILGPNQRGELCFKGPLMMKGYINNEKETRDTIRNGWLHTGDIGYYDESGEFFIVDRLKELIKYKGFQVPPAELEAILLSHPKIKDAAVIGIPDEMSGELPLAFVVKQPNAELSADEVKSFVAKQMSPAKRLHGGVRFTNEIPKNASGKILRRTLREIVKNTTSKL